MKGTGHRPDDDLLRPREAAQLFGVRPVTLARWSREGKIASVCTPGAHRRYSRAQINDILGECPPLTEPEWIGDALRLYRQGWSIRRIAAELDSGYGVIRRHLGMRLRLRDRSGFAHAAVRIGNDTDAAEKGGR